MTESAKLGSTRSFDNINNDHALLLCQIVFAIVNNEYWKDGKLFSPILSKYPGLLSFLGSGKFAEIISQ